jgi:uncharacterized tellurite resistance protein B-like protein
MTLHLENIINQMSYKTIITQLYFLLIHADGSVNEREISVGKQMVRTEGLKEDDFITSLELLKSKDTVKLYKGIIKGLQLLDRKMQIRAIGWLCVLANADGFMDKAEWQFIYKVYHRELNLPLDEIMKAQSELVRLTQRQRTIQTLNNAA